MAIAAAAETVATAVLTLVAVVAVANKFVVTTKGWQAGTDNNQIKEATAIAAVMANAAETRQRQTGRNNNQLKVATAMSDATMIATVTATVTATTTAMAMSTAMAL